MKKRMTIWARTAKVLFLAILSSFGTNAMAQTRIAVVSDIHVMAPSLLPSGAEETEAWTNYYAGQRKMLQQSAGLFTQFIDKMIDEKPDILLITGDLTKDGEQASHNYVKDELLRLKTALLQASEPKNIKIYVIPGNHDFGEEIVPNDPTGTVDHLSSSEFATFYNGYGYGTGSTIDTNGSLSYVAEPVDGIVLLAIDSQHNGIVSEATLTWICNQALSARADGKRVIAMMHHPLFPHIEGADMFISTYTVANYEAVRNALIAAGVNVILTGHFHTSDIAYDWNESQTNGIYDINTGSLISYPCDYRMLTLSSDKSTLSVATASLTPLGWTEDYCKTWLHNRVEVIAKKKMNDASMGMANYIPTLKDAIDNIALFAADLFILHAKGDENSEANQTERVELEEKYRNFKDDKTEFMGMKVYESAFEYGGITDESIYSVLTDISNYVDGTLTSGHENRTADRTLSVTLTSPDAVALLNGSDNSSVINYYNGKEATVTLTGRTLYKDNVWNTLCLPFSLTAEQINASLLAGADIRALSTNIEYDGKTTGFDNDNNALILNFTPKAPADGAVTAIEAGRPYIIKWASGDNITTDLTFTGVTIDKTMHNDGNEDVVTFRGTYAPQQFTDNDPSILLLGKDNDKSVLYYPQNTAFLGAFRAYFQLADGYAADDPSHSVRSFVMNFGSNENTTGIIAIGNSQLSTLNSQLTEWFTLDGRRLAGKPTVKGLYIHAGRKVVIK